MMRLHLIDRALFTLGLVFSVMVLPVFAQELIADPNVLQQVDTEPDVQLPENKVFHGGIRTLQEALEEEKGVVDWYGWYLACRDYLIRTGGLFCDLGTEIRFHRGGRMEAVTTDPVCQASVVGKRFDLPPGTRLKVVILPVRSAKETPASRQEIHRRTREPF